MGETPYVEGPSWWTLEAYAVSMAESEAQRLRESSTWAAWTPQLVAFIKESMHDWQKGAEHVGVKDQERHFRLQQLIVAGGYDGESAAKFSMRALQGKQLEDFKRHCAAGHKPWRSDCKACLDAMAYSRPHRRMQKSRACSLSIDISGPFRSENAEGYEVPKPKYMLVGAYTFPRFSVACKEPSIPKDERIPDTDEAEALLRDEDGSPKPSPAAEGKAEESLLPDYASLFPEDPRIRELTSTERKRIEGENQKWESIIASCQDTSYELVELPFAVVLPAKSTHAILGGLNRFYAKLRSLGLPVYRLHSDCAQEFTHPTIRQWANHRGIHVTTTMPESKASNGRAERLVGRLKQQTRALLSHHKLPEGYWPHAVRYAVESMQRLALARLGHCSFLCIGSL